MDDQYNFKVKRQEKAHCAAVSLDTEACVAFQGYVQQLGWRQQRVGFLYGTFDEDGGARVEAIYEPPQEGRDRGFELQEDDREDDVPWSRAWLRSRRRNVCGLAASVQKADEGLAQTIRIVASTRATFADLRGESRLREAKASLRPSPSR